MVWWKSYFNKILKYDPEESYVYEYLGYALINLFDLNNNKILKVIKCYNKLNKAN